MSPARWTRGLVLAADASLHAGPSTLRLAVVGGGALLLVAALLAVLVLLARRRHRAARPPGHLGLAPGGGTPSRTVIAWQPDPPAGMPPGVVPKQPRTGPRRR
jgi:hypothetical protein